MKKEIYSIRKMFFVFALFFLLQGCKNEVFNYELLKGSWTTINVLDKTGMNVFDRVTFYDTDSILVEVFADGKLQSKMLGNYTINEKSKIITTAYPNMGSFRIEVIMLKKDEFEMKELSTNNYSKMSRLKN